MFFGAAAFSGSIILVGTIVLLQRSLAFRRRWYWCLLVGAAAYCVLSPFLYMWTTAYPISYTDALLLKALHVGSRRVAESYFIFIGVEVCGVIGLALSRRSDSQPLHKQPLHPPD